MAGLKVVALISGGKDSFFSTLHCLGNGHEVVALANLHPPVSPDGRSVHDSDSYMYQTIGHAVIPLYEQALRMPLYRQEITGSAVNQDRSYGPEACPAGASEDETEALVPLLQRVIAAHPDVNAVSTGAILSDYQRTRVESVALRLGLTPLSYLWQWPSLPPNTQTSLLEDMAAVGQDARIIKVASGGLDDSFLWQNVADRRTIARLSKAALRFGSSTDGAVLGEGGEYETLAVDGPAPLWKAKIVIDEEDRKTVQGEAGSVSLRLRKPRVVVKPEEGQTVATPWTPPLLDQKYEEMLERLCSTEPVADATGSGLESHTLPEAVPNQNANSTLHTSPTTSIFRRTGAGATVAAQMRSIMDSLENQLNGSVPGAGLATVAYTSIILRNMTDFAIINSIYGSYFKLPNPPARVTIACAEVLPEGCELMLGVQCLASPTPSGSAVRRGLHVQSRSYWAPANIGPYSQAIPVSTGTGPDADGSDIVYIAGQIPLVPASMELVRSPMGDGSSNFAYQTVLALQHLTRIGDAMMVWRWVAAIAFVVATPSQSALALARTVQTTWEMLHTGQGDVEADAKDSQDFDIWNVVHGAQHDSWQAYRTQPQEQNQTLHEDVPPLWVIEVDALPRGASIEWVGYGTTTNSPLSVEIGHLHYLLQTFRHHIL